VAATPDRAGRAPVDGSVHTGPGVVHSIDDTKHPLALVEGSTENVTLVTELIVGLRERGLDNASRPRRTDPDRAAPQRQLARLIGDS
jgi:hypothetical protein